MKEYLITDFLNFNEYKKLNPKKYLEIPVFDKQHRLKKDIIYLKRWQSHKKKLEDMKENIKLYDIFLKELVDYLNKYHNKKFSKRYWSIILGPWLYPFISSISFKWKLIESLKSKKYIFLKKKINNKDVVPHGIEDFTKMSMSNYWNHYIFYKIIEFGFSKKISILSSKKIIDNNERDKIYKNLQVQPFKEKISLLIQSFFNFFSQTKKTLILSTYMTNFQELKLNLLINRSILYYKAIRPNLLFRKKRLYSFERNKLKKLKKKDTKLKNFLNQELLINFPSTFLENFDYVENILKEIPLPKLPQKIFTCLGISRSTLMDRYTANNIEGGTSLILAQHGGNYFHHKHHFNTIHEVNISDMYLTWGNLKKKKSASVGVIKNLIPSSNTSNKIILEIRMRKGYNREIKLDSGFFDSKQYLHNLCSFFSLIKNKKISRDLYVKLHEVKSFWNEKNQFLSANAKLKFLDESKKMLNEMKSAKLIIQTFCSTGHLESLAINKPTLILFLNNFNLLNNKSKNYFIKLHKMGIIHTNIKSLIKKLEMLSSKEKIDIWWNDKNKQNLLNKYRNDYCFYNKEKLKNLKELIASV
tara:strand:- start:4162 stop:5916 length:1755 start_codon:yes stop_codon:yes gene_type:complete